jgi:phosphatidate cytidylyltransferase
MAIFFPLLYVLIFLLPQLQHLGFCLLVILLTLAGAFETANFFKQSDIPSSRWTAPILSTTLPVAAYLAGGGIVSDRFHLLWLYATFGIIFMEALLRSRKERLPEILPWLASSVLIIIYPGFFVSYVIRIASAKHASYALLFFLSLIFANDTLAYVTGRLIGKSLNLALSPNKSLAGFLGGFAGTLGISALFYFVLPGLFAMSWPAVLLLGIAVGSSVIAGDLLESALKRSARVKDSGSIMLGRGGVLDSLDSILFSAPVFFYLYGWMAG